MIKGHKRTGVLREERRMEGHRSAGCSQSELTSRIICFKTKPFKLTITKKKKAKVRNHF